MRGIQCLSFTREEPPFVDSAGVNDSKVTGKPKNAEVLRDPHRLLELKEHVS